MNKREYSDYCRQAVEEGCILLENDGMLPLTGEDRIALFGREQFEYIKSGSGSGGKVNCPYVTNLNACLREKRKLDWQVEEFYKNFITENPYDEGDGWIVPSVQKQPLLSEEFVHGAAARCNKAVIVLSRVFGESVDVKNGKGGFLLTDEEENAICLAAKYFRHVAVVINSGNMIDLTWIKKYKISAVMLIWQGGQEGGAGATSLLIGEKSPSGRLPLTVADISAYSAIPFGNVSRNIHTEDIYVGYRYFLSFCPEKILYPFGYGIGYTHFSFSPSECRFEAGNAVVTLTVKNEGTTAGKEVVQIYFSAPQGKLGKAERELAAFKKTKLLASGESEQVTLSFPLEAMSAFDDTNACGFGHAFVMERGEYIIFIGKNSRDCEKCGVYYLPETICVKKASDAMHPRQSFMRLTRNGKEKVTGYDCAYPEERLAPIVFTGEKGLSLPDVATGRCSLDDFLAQFTAEELSYLVKGEGWGSPKSHIAGTAAVIGGTTPVFLSHGVPIISLCDGPSGPRTEGSEQYTCISSGILLASMWSTELISKVFQGFAEELKNSGIDVILAPGMNIQRHLFGGRNFEYFSEDPLLAGTFASEIAESFTDNGVFATLKHFAVNSQETGRDGEDEILSERALREIYLKPFEIAVKKGKVSCVMTSYSRINGVSACANLGLTDVILRREWEYDGLVMSDWWARADKFADGTFSSYNISQMIKAQNDMFMVTEDAVRNCDDLSSEFASGGLSLTELQRCALHILRFIMKTATFKNGCVFNQKTDCRVLEKRFVSQNIFIPEKSGSFVLEILYAAEGGGLEQFSVSVFTGEKLQTVFTARPVAEGKARIKLVLRMGERVRFATDRVIVKEVIVCEEEKK